jgi:hypothetical protein
MGLEMGLVKTRLSMCECVGNAWECGMANAAYVMGNILIIAGDRHKKKNDTCFLGAILYGGGSRTRTDVDRSQQIYSLLPIIKKQSLRSHGVRNGVEKGPKTSKIAPFHPDYAATLSALDQITLSLQLRGSRDSRK